MKKEYLYIDRIPAILFGETSDELFIYVHGKGSSKEAAEELAGIVGEYGFQTLSFDLPGCGERGNICSACLPEPCDHDHVVRDLLIIADWAAGNYSKLSLYARDYAGFCLEAFGTALGGAKFERCIFDSPDIAEGLDVLGKKVSTGSPDRFGFDGFVRNSL